MSPSLSDPAALFSRHGAMVYRRCRRILADDDAAREAVQEVFLRVVGRSDRFRGESSELTWIYSIATLHCLQQLRNQRRRRDKLDLFAALPEVGPEATPEDRLALAAVLDDEPFEVQQLVILRHVDAMTVDEVATCVGLSRKTVARRLEQFISRARSRLEVEEAGP